jgi:hypothetical protein
MPWKFRRSGYCGNYQVKEFKEVAADFTDFDQSLAG